MADINDGKPLAFEQGGILQLNDGGTVYAFVNRERGTLVVEDGGYERLDYASAGTPKLPREGSGLPSKITISVKLTKLESVSLVSLSKKRATTPADVYTFTSLFLVIPDNKAASTGRSRTYAGVHFAKPAALKEGAQLDTVELELRSTDPHGDDQAYIAPP